MLSSLEIVPVGYEDSEVGSYLMLNDYELHALG